MATTTLNTLTGGSTDALGIHFDRQIYNSLQPELFFEQLCTVIDVPGGNYTDRFIMMDQIATSSVTAIASSSEGTAPTAIAETATAGSSTPSQYGVTVEITDMVVLTTYFDIMTQVAQEVGRAVGRKIDANIQTVGIAGTNVLYGGGQTARANLTAADAIDATLILKGKQKMKANASPAFADGYYRAVISPNVAYDLKANTSVAQWIDVSKYAQPDKILNGEIGTIHGIRLLESANVQTISSTITVYPTVMAGQGALRVAYWLPGRVKTYMNMPEDANISNQLGQKGSVGAKVDMGVSRTQEGRLMRLETSGNALS